MNGVVSLLDNRHYEMVEQLWADLEREFDVRGVYVTPYPHFSYQIAPRYDVEALEAVLQRFASKSRPFRVGTSGLAIFTGPSPVLYIPVVRTLELTRFHEALWQEISQAGSEIVGYYHPERWMPHITIGMGDLNKDNLGRIVQYLSGRDFYWEITVDNLAFIYDTGTEQVLRSRFDFGSEVTRNKARQGRPVTQETIERLNRLREQIARENKGGPFEDSTELLRQQREERTRELMGDL